MFGQAARIVARPAAAAAAAAVTANAAQGTAHARAPPAQGAARQAAHPPAHSKIVDRDSPEGWVVADLQDDVVLFQPFDSREVDNAASIVMALWTDSPHPSQRSTVPIVTEPPEEENAAATGDEAASFRSGASSSSGVSDSDARLADAVIEAAAAGTADAVAQGRRQDREQLERLMAITTRMLKRPGMQREVVMCMMEDPEVQQLMLRQCNDLDQYLQAAGFHDPLLLPSAEATTAAGAATSSPEDPTAASVPLQDQPHHGGPNLMSRLAGMVAGALNKAGGVFAAVGDWLQRYAASMFAPEVAATREEEEEGAASEEREAQEGGGRSQGSASQVMRGVLVVAVAVFCVLLIRRPLVLRMMRR